MEKVKLAIIYYSQTGTNYQLSKWAAEGAEQAGAEVKILKVKELAPPQAIDSNPAWRAHLDNTQSVPEVSLDDLEWADAIIFSMPTRYGNVPAQLKEFIDSTGGLWFHGKLANKVVSAMTSAQNPHGGQEATLLALYTTMFHWGAIIAAPGYTDAVIFGAGGNPYGTSVTAGPDGLKEDARVAVVHQAKRTVMVASWVKQGLKG
ncbi:NAD(P)H:quinone oxidoreductase [Rufibacter psychrotolerans]|uniref:NAD(P)H:quinone oxidoreductase n=1 Tax=Rufibacter psychrotolerans TaxID=2812556 RepID=UPI0019671817|nr:NAD(P)H:quinone oxidoreductase [Rufibacter sp. SYSU D00308]